MTVGIGVLCEAGDCAVLASDMRVTYGTTKVAPHDKSGKNYAFPPFNFAAAIAGNTSSTHAVVSEFAGQLSKLIALWRKQREDYPRRSIHFEHIRNALELARKREFRRLQGCAMESLGVSLTDWIAGELPDGRRFNEYAHLEGMRILRGVKEEMKSNCSVLLVGFLRDIPIFCRAIGAAPIEESTTPAIHTIGGRGAIAAMQHLVERKQNIEMGIARTLLHVHEAMEIAKGDKGVGEPSAYTIMRPWTRPRPNGRLRFPPDHPMLSQWKQRYASGDTEGLENNFANELVDRAMVPDRSKPSQQLGPKGLQTEL